MHTEVFGTVSSWVLRMEVSQYVFIGAYNVVIFSTVSKLLGFQRF